MCLNLNERAIELALVTTVRYIYIYIIYIDNGRNLIQILKIIHRLANVLTGKQIQDVEYGLKSFNNFKLYWPI